MALDLATMEIYTAGDKGAMPDGHYGNNADRYDAVQPRLERREAEPTLLNPALVRLDAGPEADPIPEGEL